MANLTMPLAFRQLDHIDHLCKMMENVMLAETSADKGLNIMLIVGYLQCCFHAKLLKLHHNIISQIVPRITSRIDGIRSPVAAIVVTG